MKKDDGAKDYAKALEYARKTNADAVIYGIINSNSAEAYKANLYLVDVEEENTLTVKDVETVKELEDFVYKIKLSI